MSAILYDSVVVVRTYVGVREQFAAADEDDHTEIHTKMNA